MSNEGQLEYEKLEENTDESISEEYDNKSNRDEGNGKNRDKNNGAKRSNSSRDSITFGCALAMIISYTEWKSIGWAIFHGLLSWIYVVYYIFTYKL